MIPTWMLIIIIASLIISGVLVAVGGFLIWMGERKGEKNKDEDEML